jgi:hypothetical protein
MVDELHPAIRRDHVDVVGLEFLPILDLYDAHLRARRDDVRELAPPVRVQMDHHDEGGTGSFLQLAKEGLKGLDSPGPTPLSQR